MIARNGETRTSLGPTEPAEAPRRPSAKRRPARQSVRMQLSHPFITRARLARIPAPVTGEHMLKVGAGTGYYSFAVAEQLFPGGRLDIVDHDQDALDRTMRRVRRRAISGTTGMHADACSLPYPDDRFDGAYIITTLGQVRDQVGALRELRRVLKPSDRLVVGDFLGDPDVVTFRRLCERATQAELRFEQRLGGPLGYFARFLPCCG